MTEKVIPFKRPEAQKTAEEKVKERIQYQASIDPAIQNAMQEDIQLRIKTCWDGIRAMLEHNRCVMLPEFKFNMMEGPGISLNIIPREYVEAAMAKTGPTGPQQAPTNGAAPADSEPEPPKGGDDNVA